ncbi:hypothetical protein [Flavobacterium okayamense]|uniref:Peptidase S74 domain-containing protein n=1 Tax=Flavobacterium okayamense TaxID=2830782 RepID=A0ABM7S4K1_9FLAO|nr:hypothetical protein [Flavobacterium okayamense]BCY27852.1 hypothetical protein KK2020170_07200 [Flavobacterium okayamense]
MKKVFTVLFLIFGLTSFAQVGINTTSPTATLHVYGNTTLPSGGGTINLLNQNFDTPYTVVHSNNGMVGCTGPGTNGWVRTTTGNTNSNCSSCTGGWLWINSDESGCGQNATARVDFTTAPTTTSISISFAYRYNNFGAAPDSFRAYLYNNTTNAQVGGNLVNLTTDANTSYSGSATVVAGNSYSLRFEYQGNFDYGASIDNILVTETSAPSGGTFSFRLEDGTQSAGKVLTSDANGNGYWETPAGGTDSQTLSIVGNDLTISNGNTVTLPSGGGGSYTFTNALTETSGTVRLGGALTQNTAIDLNTRNLNFNGTNTGDLFFEGNTLTVLETNFGDNYINFGDGGAFIDSDEGQTFSDTYNGGPFTKKFVAGFYKGSSGGTAIALGSIEYIVDGTNELFYEGSAFSPMSDFGADLGASPFSGVTRRWDDVYADDFITPTNTYSKTSNKNSNLQNRGLTEIMQLNPISYKENTPSTGNINIPDNQKANKLGFDAQELSVVIPEAVKKSDWVCLDESGKRTYIEYEKPVGIMPYQIIPVTVKAIQEQQNQIEELKKEIALLKEMVNALKNKE